MSRQRTIDDYTTPCGKVRAVTYDSQAAVQRCPTCNAVLDHIDALTVADLDAAEEVDR